MGESSPIYIRSLCTKQILPLVSKVVVHSLIIRPFKLAHVNVLILFGQASSILASSLPIDLHQMRALHQFMLTLLLQKLRPLQWAASQPSSSGEWAVTQVPFTLSHPSFVHGIVVSARACVARLIANKAPKIAKFIFFLVSPFVYGLLKPF